MSVDLYYPTVHEDGSSSTRETAIVVRNLMEGKANNKGEITLTAASATTTLTDLRLGPESVISFMPLDTGAKTEGIPYVTAQGDGTATLNHANNATVRTYRYAIVG